jgi:hypothetical protein
MVAFPTSPSRGYNRRSIRTKWRTLPKAPIRPPMVDIHPSWFRSLRSGHIPHYSSKCTARMPSKSTLRSSSTNSLVRHSPHTSPRERSAHSVRNMMPPSTACHRRTCTHSPRQRNAGGSCTSAWHNAFSATPPRQYLRYKRVRREKTRSLCTVMRILASRRTSTTRTTSRPTRNPIPTGIIRSEPSTSTRVWVPTPIRRRGGCPRHRIHQLNRTQISSAVALSKASVGTRSLSSVIGKSRTRCPVAL